VSFEERAGVYPVERVGQELEDLRVEAARHPGGERGPVRVQAIDPTCAHSARE
jgi:hypothetical protein